MTKKEYEKVEEIIDSFIEEMWVTPCYVKQFIPNEKIPMMKRRIKELVKCK